MGGGATKELQITKSGVFQLRFSNGPSSYLSLQEESVVHVSCSSEHSAVVTKSGYVFTFGSNADSQLGLEEDAGDTVANPTLVTALRSVPISQAACGLDFTFFLTAAGELFACGANAHGQLGIGSNSPSPYPVRVTGIPTIRKVATGAFHTVALSVTGEVWVTGFNSMGQLGLGHTEDKTTFTRILSCVCGPVIDVSCGGWHTAVLSASGALFTAGLNDGNEEAMAQLLSNDPDLCSLRRVILPLTVAAVACGYTHTVAITMDGTTWAWGCNDSGQLGVGDKVNSFTPKRLVGLEKYRIAKVSAGGNQTALITEGGDVLICGRMKDAELEQYKVDLEIATLVTKSSELIVEQVAPARTYTLLLVKPEREPEHKSIEITDWERSILSSLECPVCYKIMSAPIHLCAGGHNLCSACLPHTKQCPLCCQPFTATRSYALEGLSASVPLPCTECLLRMPTPLLEDHGSVCPGRIYGCPTGGLCGWRGWPAAMLAHVTTAHTDQTWLDLPRLFLHTDFDGLLQTNVLAAHHQVFVLHRKYDTTSHEFLAAVKFIGRAATAHMFRIELEFIAGDNSSVMFRKNICADTESAEDMFKSDNCITLTRAQLDKFIQSSKLVCQVTISKTCEIRAGLVRALVNA